MFINKNKQILNAKHILKPNITILDSSFKIIKWSDLTTEFMIMGLKGTIITITMIFRWFLAFTRK